MAHQEGSKSKAGRRYRDSGPREKNKWQAHRTWEGKIALGGAEVGEHAGSREAAGKLQGESVPHLRSGLSSFPAYSGPSGSHFPQCLFSGLGCVGPQFPHLFIGIIIFTASVCHKAHKDIVQVKLQILMN